MPDDLTKTIRCRWPSTRGDGWSFPQAVNRFLHDRFAGKRVLHLFGGKTDFGIRLDIDPEVHPDILGDAWLPPFAADSFDVVILDPPYSYFNGQRKTALLMVASMIARESIVWFHTLYINKILSNLKEQENFVILGRNGNVRSLQIFEVGHPKLGWPRYYRRGPEIRYNRWLANPQALPFPAQPES